MRKANPTAGHAAGTTRPLPRDAVRRVIAGATLSLALLPPATQAAVTFDFVSVETLLGAVSVTTAAPDGFGNWIYGGTGFDTGVFSPASSLPVALTHRRSDYDWGLRAANGSVSGSFVSEARDGSGNVLHSLFGTSQSFTAGTRPTFAADAWTYSQGSASFTGGTGFYSGATGAAELDIFLRYTSATSYYGLMVSRGSITLPTAQTPPAPDPRQVSLWVSAGSEVGGVGQVTGERIFGPSQPLPPLPFAQTAYTLDPAAPAPFEATTVESDGIGNARYGLSQHSAVYSPLDPAVPQLLFGTGAIDYFGGLGAYAGETSSGTYENFRVPAANGFLLLSVIRESDTPIPGTSPDNPILPNMPTASGGFFFADPEPGRWFDPPVVEGFTIALSGGGTFIEVIAPPGFDNLSLVVGGVVVNDDLDAGESFLFGAGVSSFDIVGISPLLDPDDPGFGSAFPLYLDFTNPPGTTMTWTPIAVPEPATWASLGLGLVFVGLVRSRRRVALRGSA